MARWACRLSASSLSRRPPDDWVAHAETRLEHPMFEFDKFDPVRRRTSGGPMDPYEPFRGATHRAFLLWGEHCIECAAPDCYSSCNLYDPRSDRRCRRFEYGTFANADFPGGFGNGADVTFRVWGKLEARGNCTLLPVARVRAL